MGAIVHLKTETREKYDNDNYSSLLLLIKENKFRKNVEEIPKFHGNENYDNEFSNIEDDDDYDNEDGKNLLDGGNRAERQAQKHRRIVMSIIRCNDDT